MAMVMRVDPEQQLQVVERQLLTRTNLIDTAQQFEVFEDIRSMNPDEIVERMQNQTSVRRSGGRNAATLMTLSFDGRSPRVVSDVVNQYVTLILAENAESRVARAEGTLNFFEREVERLSENLDVQSARLVEFRNANADALPDDLSFRQGRVTLLQERQARLERDIASAERQKREMIAVFEATGQVAQTDARPLTREEEQLAEMELQLQQALGVYSESHPRIIALRNRIEQMGQRIAEARPASETNPEPQSAPVSMLDLTLAEIDQRVESMEQELETVTEELTELEASIAATASNAIALNSLQRDYENIQIQYNEAVSNLNRARMSERIEVTAQGQRITVIEGANVPQLPSGPNKLLIVAGGGAAGALLAAGLFLLLELLNRTIRRPAELESRFGVTTLAVVPYMESRREVVIRRSALVAGFMAVLITVPAGLYYIDNNYMPLQIIVARVAGTLGLM
jgi:uncharacterized protein involved in exopolysaccharide biosynthesis